MSPNIVLCAGFAFLWLRAHTRIYIVCSRAHIYLLLVRRSARILLLSPIVWRIQFLEKDRRLCIILERWTP